MPRLTSLISNFSSGEVSPRMRGRSDQARYQNACRVMENMVTTILGPSARRPGSRFVAEVKTSASRTESIPFEFNVEQTYVIEIGNLYMRFYKDKFRIESPPGTPVEIAAPWAQADLFGADGAHLLGYTQSADVLYLVHAKYPPHKLSRLSHTSWTLTRIAFQDGPWLEENFTIAQTMTPSATTGAITLTATGHAPFVATDIGRLVRVGHPAANWVALTAYVAGDIRQNLGNIFECMVAGTSGAASTGGPNDISDYINDGTVQWRWRNADGTQWGWAEITGFTSSTVVSATVKGRFAAATASFQWRLGAWSDTTGWPAAVSFHEEGLWFAKDQRLDRSGVGDFENMAPGVEDDQAKTYVLASDQVNAIQWMRSLDSLLLGTRGSEWSFSPEPDLRARRETLRGSRGLSAVISNQVLFVQRNGRKLYQMSHQYRDDPYGVTDLTQLADHVTLSGIVDIAFQQEPWSILWCARADGQLIGLTYLREEEVIGWHRHPMSNGFVESVCVIAGPSGDELWMIVRRIINGVTKRYMEVLEPPLGDDGLLADAWYVDSGLKYDGAPTSTLSGLDHLEGQTVSILADGEARPTAVVTGGAVSLAKPASKAIVGLGYRSILEPLPPEGPGAEGTTVGKKGRVAQLLVRLDRSLGGKIGRSLTGLQEIPARKASDPMDAPPPLFTGDHKLVFPGDYSSQQEVFIVQDLPLPWTVICLTYEMRVSDG